MFTFSAPGKLILMGEHAVLYDQPCLVSAVDKRIACSLTPRKDDAIHLVSDEMGELTLTLDDLKAQSSFDKKWQFVCTALKHMNIPTGCDVHIQSDFSPVIGLGSSAAVTVAMMGCLHEWLFSDWTDEQVFDASYDVVYTAQGKAGSGADIAASVYGGVLLYKKGEAVQSVPVKDCPLVAVYCGYKTPTPEVIAKVKTWMEQDPAKYDALYKAMGNLVREGYSTIKNDNYMKLGDLFNQNHTLLQKLGVSDQTLDYLVDELNKQDAINGAKISGAGLGDCVIALGTARSINEYQSVELKITDEGIKNESNNKTRNRQQDFRI